MVAGQTPLRVLLVDDESEFLAATAKALRRRGFEPQTAEDGLAALDRLERESFDAVVLDVKMPGLDGEQVFYEVRRRWPSLPVIILTGHGTVQQAFKTSRDGLYEYLPKPCEVDELARVLRTAVEATRRRRSSASPEPLPLRLLFLHGSSLASTDLATALKRRGANLFSAGDAAQAMSVVRNQNIDVVLIDLSTVALRSADLVRLVHERQRFAEVVLLVDRRSLRQGVEALRAGAFDVLLLPASVEEVEGCVHEARVERQSRTAEEIERRVQEILAGFPD